jgi:hypothetical protein
MVKSQHHYSRYQRFMDALKCQSVDGYCEMHHIVPRSLGGSDDKDNLIKLTPRQHYIAHWMLWKACGGVAGRSFFMMSNLGKYGKVNSTTYAQARENYSEQVKKQMAERPNRPAFTPVGNAQRGRKLSDETKRKISATKKRALSQGNTPEPADEAE